MCNALLVMRDILFCSFINDSLNNRIDCIVNIKNNDLENVQELFPKVKDHSSSVEWLSHVSEW